MKKLNVEPISTLGADGWIGAMTAGQPPEAVEKEACGGCRTTAPCEECGASRADPTHQKAEWADLVASTRPGASAFWHDLLIADAFFAPDSGGERPDPTSPISRAMEVRQRIASSGTEQALLVIDDANHAVHGDGRLSAAHSGGAHGAHTRDLGGSSSVGSGSGPVLTYPDEPPRIYAANPPRLYLTIDRPTYTFWSQGGAAPGCCCTVVRATGHISGGLRLTKISITVALDWILLPDSPGVRIPCSLEWHERSDLPYPIPGYPGNELPGDSKWHQLYPPPPGSRTPYPQNVRTFQQWEAAIAAMGEAPCPTPADETLGFTINDGAPWDPKVAKRDYGRSTRWLEGYVRIKSGCQGKSKKTIAVTWRTECGSDGYTTPPTPTSIPGVIED